MMTNYDYMDLEVAEARFRELELKLAVLHADYDRLVIRNGELAAEVERLRARLERMAASKISGSYTMPGGPR